MADDLFKFQIQGADKSAKAFNSALGRARKFAKSATSVVSAPFRALTSGKLFF